MSDAADLERTITVLTTIQKCIEEQETLVKINLDNYKRIIQIGLNYASENLDVNDPEFKQKFNKLLNFVENTSGSVGDLGGFVDTLLNRIENDLNLVENLEFDEPEQSSDIKETVHSIKKTLH